MQNYILIFLAALMCSCGNTFTIEGNITDLKANYLYYPKVFNSDTEELDSVKIENGKFILEGDFTENDLITIYSSDDRFVADVIIEKGKIPILGTCEQYVINTKENLLFQKLLELDKEYSQFPRAVYEAKYLNALLSFSSENPNSIGCLNACFTLVMFFNSGDFSAEEYEQLKANFSELKEHDIYKKMTDLVDAAKKRKPGNELLNYEVQTLKGKKIMLHDILGDGITVIDIWASWCSFCRELTPKYKLAAEKYKDQNIKFVFLSLDDKKALWTKAVEEDELKSFVHVSSLKGREDQMKNDYRMFGIPDNIIVDKEGKIIANHKRDILVYLEEYYASKNRK